MNYSEAVKEMGKREGWNRPCELHELHFGAGPRDSEASRMIYEELEAARENEEARLANGSYNLNEGPLFEIIMDVIMSFAEQHNIDDPEFRLISLLRYADDPDSEYGDSHAWKAEVLRIV